jgi:hypothetical protein
MPLSPEQEALCERLEKGESTPTAATLIRQQAREIDDLWDRLSRAYALVRQESPARMIQDEMEVLRAMLEERRSSSLARQNDGSQAGRSGSSQCVNPTRCRASTGVFPQVTLGAPWDSGRASSRQQRAGDAPPSMQVSGLSLHGASYGCDGRVGLPATMRGLDRRAG